MPAAISILANLPLPHGALLLAAVFLPLGLLPFLPLTAKRLSSRTGYVAMLAPLVSLLCLLGIAWQEGPAPNTISEWRWIPSLGLNLSLVFDGLSLFYGVVICGVGVLICWYAATYIGDRYPNHGRFYACLMLFVTAMLGTVFSENLLLLFVFWELTGIASFLLIGFYHTDLAARVGARRALLVTAGTGLCMMVGIILLGLGADTYSLSAILAMDDPSGGRGVVWMNVALLLLMLGVFGKSAQFPFHFWLPGAMVAPTPVSAYLHSATMVKLGVFLTARLFPIFAQQELWFPLLTGVGFFTMVLGSWLALRSNDLKAILAYSTISQLGMLIGSYGVAGATGVRFDFLLIGTHVLYKAALFMIAGIVDHATGTRDVRELGGVGRLLPLTTVACAVALASFAGVPFTVGFLGKESMFTELLAARADHPLAAWVLFGAMAVSAVLTVAVAIRMFGKVFLGERPEGMSFHAPGWKMQLPPALLAVLTLLLGCFPGVAGGLLNLLKVPGLHRAEAVDLHLWHGFNLELMTSLGAFVAGTVLYVVADRSGWKRTVIPSWLRFDVAFERSLDLLTEWARKLTHLLRADSPLAYLPIVISFLLLSMAAVMLGGDLPALRPHWEDWSAHPLRIAVVSVIATACLSVLFLQRWTSQLVALSVAGFFITFYYVLYHAPDLAMTQILVESASVVMMLLLLARFPATSQIGVQLEASFSRANFAKILLSLGVGLLMTLLVLLVEPLRHADPAGARMLELTVPLAEGANAVNTILVDFRGFDTLGEITVILIATLGGLGLMMRYKRGKTPADPRPIPGFLLGKERDK